MKKIIFSLLVLALVAPGPALALYQANSSATVVVGQQYLNYIPGAYHGGTPNQGDITKGFRSNINGLYSDGTRLFVADAANNRVLIYNSLPTENDPKPDVVIGQPDFYATVSNQGGNPGANTLSNPRGVYATGTQLFIADASNNRVLIYNTIPTSNNASADVVIGQPDFISNSENQGGSVGANTFRFPSSIYASSTKLFITDQKNNRVLIYNNIPTENNASADVVIGQPNKTTSAANYGGRSAKSLSTPMFVNIAGSKLFITDTFNNRILIFNNIPSADYAEANVVVGQTAMNLGSSAIAANRLNSPWAALSDGNHLFISDSWNNRVLIYNTIPTVNGSSADVVIGQVNL
ncbi:MAG TPA: hypothetical protein PLR18_03590, partial [bacterium]|nr:hypothetical protein [bacterium]